MVNTYYLFLVTIFYFFVISLFYVKFNLNFNKKRCLPSFMWLILGNDVDV